MSDFSFVVDASRDEVSEMLIDRQDQTLYVIAEVLNRVTADDLLEDINLPQGLDMELLLFNLKAITAALTAHHQGASDVSS